MNNDQTSRRGLFQAAAAVAATTAFGARAQAAPARTHGLKLGVASYSMRKYPVDRVIETCTKADIRYITLKDMHLPLKSTADEIAATLARFQAANITIMGGGVITMKKDEAAIRKAFDYARAAKFPLIVASPEPDALDLVEAMIKEFNIPVAIHNHGPEDKVWKTPQDIMAAVKKRDARLGVCMDIGHTARAGEDPVKAVGVCGARLMDLHVKDLKNRADKDSLTELGKGDLNVAGLLKVLHKRRFAGQVGLEYEINADDPATGIRECFGYMRGVMAALTA